jgi:hypothetical protein
MKEDALNSRYEPGDIIKFKKRKKHQIAGLDFWLDLDENSIPGGSTGIILSKRFIETEEEDMWEYDISIPSLGVISRGWNDFAFSPVSVSKKGSTSSPKMQL